MLNVIRKIVKWYLITMGVILTALIIYYWPVIDRLIIRPCHYYPETFANCREDK